MVCITKIGSREEDLIITCEDDGQLGQTHHSFYSRISVRSANLVRLLPHPRVLGNAVIVGSTDRNMPNGVLSVCFCILGFLFLGLYNILACGTLV
jgi:hypothetical protein